METLLEMSAGVGSVLLLSEIQRFILSDPERCPWQFANQTDSLIPIDPLECRRAGFFCGFPLLSPGRQQRAEYVWPSMLSGLPFYDSTADAYHTFID